MIKRTYLKGGSINIGNIVQIGLSKVDLAKTDCENLTLMVVEERTFRENLSLYYLANKLFQLKNLCGAGLITIIKDIDLKLVNLDRILKYQGLS